MPVIRPSAHRKIQIFGGMLRAAAALVLAGCSDAGKPAERADPDFDPRSHAFYYVRALEIPTPRGSTPGAAGA